MHCHFPSDILIHVSVQRSRTSKALPFSSVPLPTHKPVAMAVSPNTVTCTFSFSALTILLALASARDCALLVTFPSLPVLTNWSASNGAARSGLLVFCDLSH